METIKKIRFEARNSYFSKLEPLKLEILDNTVWKSQSHEIKLKTLEAIQEGRLTKANYIEIEALKKAGYTVIRGKTLEEWQNYFCDILDKKNIKLNPLNIDDVLLKQIFTKEQYSKLITIIYSSKNKLKIDETKLLDRRFIL